MDIKIRPAQASDYPAMETLQSQIVRVHYTFRPDLFRSDFINGPVCMNEDADAPAFVAVDEQGRIVGCLWCVIMHVRNNSMKIDRDWLCIDDLCVDEKFRRRGIGRQLVEYARRLAKERGLSRIELNVYSDNLDAVRFYERMGFNTQKRVMELDV